MTHGPQSSDDRGRARASALDLLQLGAALGADFLRGKRSDPAGAGSKWAHDISQKSGGADIDIALPGQPLELVVNQAHSDSVLSGTPDVHGYHAGHAKTT